MRRNHDETRGRLASRMTSGRSAWRRLGLCSATLLCLAVGAPCGFADTAADQRRDGAQAHFDKGLAAYKAGDYTTARKEFSESLNLLEPGRMAAPTATEAFPIFSQPNLQPLPAAQRVSGAGGAPAPVLSAQAPP